MDVFEDQVMPLIEKAQAICRQNNIPIVTLIQPSRDHVSMRTEDISEDSILYDIVGLIKEVLDQKFMMYIPKDDSSGTVL